MRGGELDERVYGSMRGGWRERRWWGEDVNLLLEPDPGCEGPMSQLYPLPPGYSGH